MAHQDVQQTPPRPYPPEAPGCGLRRGRQQRRAARRTAESISDVGCAGRIARLSSKQLARCWRGLMATIVLIDDEPGILRSSVRILEMSGHTVLPFQNGRPAIEHIEIEKPDLVITDIFMPEMEGLETLKRTREICPEIPILAISGDGSIQAMDYLKFATRFGATATLSKPFRPNELVETLLSRQGASPRTR